MSFGRVLIVTAPGQDGADIVAAFEDRRFMHVVPLAEIDEEITRHEIDCSVIDIDLTDGATVALARERLSRVRDRRRMFVVPDNGHRYRLQATVLGGHDVIRRPLKPEIASVKLRRLVAASQTEKGQVENAIARFALETFDMALVNGKRLAVRGRAPNRREFEEAADIMVNAARTTSFEGWMELLRDHHAASFHEGVAVAGNAVLFGRALGMSRNDLTRIALAGMLHDIGNVAIPREVLGKTGPLTASERFLLLEHPIRGAEILESGGEFDHELVDVTLHHHEFLDGSGYPHGLSGKEISDPVRLITITSIFSALVQNRPHRPAMAPDAAIACMTAMGDKLDQPVVRAIGRLVAP